MVPSIAPTASTDESTRLANADALPSGSSSCLALWRPVSIATRDITFPPIQCSESGLGYVASTLARTVKASGGDCSGASLTTSDILSSYRSADHCGSATVLAAIQNKIPVVKYACLACVSLAWWLSARLHQLVSEGVAASLTIGKD